MASSYPQESYAATTVHGDSLIGQRRAAVARNTLQYQLDVLKKTGRYDAFKLQWHPVYDEPPLVWPVPNHLFWDSDVAKWIEGACYFLQSQAMPEIDAAVHELVDMIRAAQQPDGYLNIHYTVVQPGKRFTNLRDMHEMYNLGHLIEAALAHQELYRNDRLMEPIVKYVDLLCDTFGPGPEQLHGYPGHPEIELALLRLAERTKDPRHRQLARYFITERGNPTGADGKHYFEWEKKRRGESDNTRPAYYPEVTCHWYHQAQAPIAEQKTIEGHSVRAMYLLTAAADLLRLERPSQDAALEQALYTLWDNMTQRKMYVTGGIGAIKQWEGFGVDYFLPQGTDEGGCYAETCAAIGVMMLAERILQFDLDARFADTMELCLYNAVLTAMSADGKAFTYENQLASSDKDLSKRSDWFTVSCCPPNVLRLLGQIGGYIWSESRSGDETTLVAHLYISSTHETAENFTVTQTSNWPWDGKIAFTTKGDAAKTTLKLRIPGWATSHTLEPACPEASVSKGYLTLPASYLTKHASFSLTIPLEHRFVAPHPHTNQHTVALVRGPIVYCVEDMDNAWVTDHFKNTYVSPTARVTSAAVHDATTGDDYVALTLHDGARQFDPASVVAAPAAPAGSLQQQLAKAKAIEELHFVPFYFRANRGGKGHMRVGLKTL